MSKLEILNTLNRRHNNMIVYRGEEALAILREIKGKFSDENIYKWRNVCCVGPDISDNNGLGECISCPIGQRPPPKKEDQRLQYGWCHDWYEASWKLRLRRRLENIRSVLGIE